MFDPEAVGGNKIHCLVVNLTQENQHGDTVVPYEGPHPPKGSGIHHYHFWLLEQQGPVEVPPTLTLRTRHIAVGELLASFPTSLCLVGENFFRSSYQTEKK